ncbi:MAG TPA: hypothetical protein H9728_03540 [Candidatus Borkfalkia excrementavium]|uniref:Desulfoferrodoxin n=1 Tax=Candidatus Borkfalkia excrementavium TaxID=2838505 RepID=A0A9D1Z731_9FIRM|nr:hypothetical protein [Candidatus Borkfalkia excrementavium]
MDKITTGGNRVMKFYKCMHCGNVAVKVHDAGVPLVCCGEKMKELIAGESDGAAEKHVPAYSENGGRVLVEVGSVAHPMTEEHSINFIALETKKGYQIAYLRAGEKPEAEFSVVSGDEVVAVYAYCNLHGLWKA